MQLRWQNVVNLICLRSEEPATGYHKHIYAVHVTVVV